MSLEYAQGWQCDVAFVFLFKLLLIHSIQMRFIITSIMRMSINCSRLYLLVAFDCNFWVLKFSSCGLRGLSNLGGWLAGFLAFVFCYMALSHWITCFSLCKVLCGLIISRKRLHT